MGAGLFRKGLQWDVRNGRSVAFWQDNWIERKPLCNVLLNFVSEKELDKKIFQYWDSRTGWRSENFAQ